METKISPYRIGIYITNFTCTFYTLVHRSVRWAKSRLLFAKIAMAIWFQVSGSMSISNGPAP